MALEKKRYYVSVQGRSVLDDPGAAAYEWAVEATSEEADTLKHLLGQLDEKEESTFWPSPFLGRIRRKAMSTKAIKAL